PNPHFYRLHELEKGKRYLVYVTTYAGLYRYNMNDMVECTGYYGTIPMIQFIQKVNGIVSMTGEKLHEKQFIDAVQEASRQTGLAVQFFVGFADLQDSVYHMYFEFEKRDITQAQCNDFTAKVDEYLKKENMEYAAKRDSFRVKAPVGHILVRNAFEKYKEEKLKDGGRDGAQFKMLLLMQDDAKHEIFKKLTE
ncbi:MAG: GH3 auxin-responsive promoter family protein, partial [Treponemataceae bacterium]|nr:GH3 auxin-responsive promoter family protein [Treponemataceae bacterium]